MKLAAFLAMLAIAAPASAQELRPEASPAARAALAEFAGCIARTSNDKVDAALTADFKTRAYGRALRSLSENNRDCFRSRGTMRAGGLPLAAALAEAMLHRSHEPLNVRLLRASAIDAPTFSATDRVAMCVARSDPDNSARLLSAGIASDAEAAAAAALEVAVKRCTPAGVGIDLTPYGLRSIVATASYRLLAAAGEAR